MATLASLASLVGGEVVGDAQLHVHSLADLETAGPADLSFFANPRYLAALQRTRAGAVLASEAIERAPCPLIVCPDPYLAMARVAQAMAPDEQASSGIHPSAIVDASASVDPTATVGPGAVIEAGARIGMRSHVGPLAFVGSRTCLGVDCILHSGVRVLRGCSLGDRVILHAGVVIGSDGFGFAVDRRSGKRHKIPQLGSVVVGDDVEIGANSTVDRGTFGATRIGHGCKIDHLVQIAHNVVLGCHCVVVSQTGIAGSTVVGDRVVMGAQVGVIGHIRIADDVMLGARAGVARNIDVAGTYSGAPAVAHRQWLRSVTAQNGLPELRRQVRDLQARLDALSASS